MTWNATEWDETRRVATRAYPTTMRTAPIHPMTAKATSLAFSTTASVGLAFVEHPLHHTPRTARDSPVILEQLSTPTGTIAEQMGDRRQVWG